MNNREDADDLAQEVFVQVHAGLDRFRREADLSTWIYRIAVNKSLDFVHRSRRKKRLAGLRSLVGPARGDAEVPGPPGDDPQRRLEDEERKRILARAVDRLPSSQRTAIILSQYEGFGHGEAAAIMGLSVPAMEALVHRAKKNLHKDLREHFAARAAAAHGSAGKSV